MQSSPLLHSVVLALMVSAATVSGQVTAHQGTPEVTSFESPMVLDLPLPNIAPLAADSQLQLPDTRKYVCDKNVSLVNLAITKRVKGHRDKISTQLVVSGSVVVERSHDRRVDIALRIQSKDHVLASQTLHNLKAEEGRRSAFQVTLPVDDKVLRDASTSEPQPTLEITLTVRDDS
jgi:hypothetical protein